jgi:hypothetical protein
MSFAIPNTLVCELQQILDELCITKSVKIFDEWEIRLANVLIAEAKTAKMNYLSYDFIDVKNTLSSTTTYFTHCISALDVLMGFA